MAYDEELAARIRDLTAGEIDLREQKMFGGDAFLIGGHISVAASGQGGILVHVARDASETLVASTSAEPMLMRDKPVRGWVRVDSDHLRTERELETWVERGVEYARSLPPKSVTSKKH